MTSPSTAFQDRRRDAAAAQDLSNGDGASVYTYSGSDLIQIDKTVSGGAVYRKTFTYLAGVMQTQSAWTLVP